MLEARIDNNQLRELTKNLELTERRLQNLAVKVFKASAKDFSNKVIKRASNEQKIRKAGFAVNQSFGNEASSLNSTGEFDPGSERTLAACLIHASRT